MVVVGCEGSASDMMGSACGCVRCAEKSLLIVVSVVLLITVLHHVHRVRLTMYNALVRPVVPHPLTRPTPPIRAFDPSYTRKIPAYAALRRCVYIHSAGVVVGKRCGGLRIRGGEAAEAASREGGGVAGAFAFDSHVDKYIGREELGMRWSCANGCRRVCVM